MEGAVRSREQEDRVPAYTTEQLCRILGLDEKRLRYWQKIGLFPRGNEGFDWSDLSRARTLMRLVEAEGLSARGLLPYAPILESHRVRGDGKALVVRDGEQFREVRSGQWMLDFESSESEVKVLPLSHEWADQAHQAFDSGDPEQARRLAGRAIRQGGTSLEDLNDLGLLLLTTGDHDSAMKILKEAAESPEAGPRQWFNLSHAYDALSRFEDSRDALEIALKLDEGFADARFNLALTYERLGETGKAYKQWREFLKRHPLEQEAETVKVYLSKAYADGRVVPLRGQF
jgi:tetratricopeptide (TPR) repeat protein